MRRATGVAAAILLLALPAPLYGSRGRELSAFSRAERLRASLESRPQQERTRWQYARVLNSYRAIYHSNPASPRADASIAAVADLLAEEGRVFADDKALHDAIGQYEFLRTQYPGSRYRFSALLAEGEIEQRDLHDPQAARVVYEKFLRLYPHNPLAEEARGELRDLRRAERAHRGRPPRQGSRDEAARDRVLTAAIRSREELRHHDTVATAHMRRGAPPPRNESDAARQQIAESDIPAPDLGRPQGTASAVKPATTSPGAVPALYGRRPEEGPPQSHDRLPLITGIRHWSTPNYTRVAIDLQQEVRYEAIRVPKPDRIFFDLYGARLSPQLAGRSVEVIDNGFLTRIRAAQFSGEVTRIVLDVNSVSNYSAFFLPNPPRLIIDVHGRRSAPPLQVAHNSPPPQFTPPPQTPREHPSVRRSSVETGSFPSERDDASRSEVASLNRAPHQVRATARPTTEPVAESVDGARSGPQPEPAPQGPAKRKPSAAIRAVDGTSAAGGESAAPAVPSQHLPTSMVRALGLKINRIVIDAGHGGHDSGTLGPGGLEEKDVVLDVALRLGRLLRQHLGADVIYTRTNDTFVPLETRTAIANQAQADLFISIHANSSSDTDARGVEVYYLNFTTSADALEVAARENSVSDESIHQLSDLVRKIALQDKINESREFAEDVDASLYAGLEQGNPGLRDRGVKKAPFVVLIGANMPSILAEISFLTNPDDAAELRQARYRERIAEALYRGVARYVSSLNGLHIAQASSRDPGTE